MWTRINMKPGYHVPAFESLDQPLCQKQPANLSGLRAARTGELSTNGPGPASFIGPVLYITAPVFCLDSPRHAHHFLRRHVSAGFMTRSWTERYVLSVFTQARLDEHLMEGTALPRIGSPKSTSTYLRLPSWQAPPEPHHVATELARHSYCHLSCAWPPTDYWPT
ncbi:hypothetical protein CONLIGDRAFT_244871 [Coniochaeta ligniaria NRRL 30616]|uniref:Uncharacterized protein n=1 Tax=Coniochaeta ligniaria NRRL 30616 TaxID=1408157 RepID=A0A1J7IXI7_9PEZI|nr:hypothetical protein CONLIGDRAFT_244871 [Coniochaeta ligniaria NRRL 30616]